MTAQDWLVWGQVVGGFSTAAGVLVALLAIPRALWQASEQRRSQAAVNFHEARRIAVASCLSLMEAIEKRRAGIVRLDPSDKGTDWSVVEILSVEMAFDQFRSDLAEALRLFERAGRAVDLADLLGLYRCAKHLWVVADVHSNTTVDEVESSVGRKVYSHDIEMLSYQSHIITEFLNEELESHPIVARLKKEHPRAGLSMEFEFEQAQEAGAKK